MFSALSATAPREWAKWCVCAVLLLAPGSFIVLPMLWIGRQLAARVLRPAATACVPVRRARQSGGAPGSDL